LLNVAALLHDLWATDRQTCLKVSDVVLLLSVGIGACRVASVTFFCFDKTSATIAATRALSSSDSAAIPSGPFHAIAHDIHFRRQHNDATYRGLFRLNLRVKKLSTDVVRSRNGEQYHEGKHH
jgi:hypothetical protein